MNSTTGNVRKDNIYISKVPNEISGEELWTYFSEIGKVVMVRVESDESGEYQRAFISFRDIIAASRVIFAKFHTVKDFYLRVFPMDNWNEPAAENVCYCWSDEGKSNETTNIRYIAMPLNGSNITSLNDDCLEMIFASLNLRDQIRLAHVCGRFREVFIMFCKREYKTFQLDRMHEMTLWEKRDFFRLAGKYIEHITGKFSYEIYDRVLQCIVVHCPNVKKLSINNTEVHSDCFTILMWSMPKLEEITWRDRNYDDEYIKSMTHLTKLRSLSICGNYLFRGQNLNLLVNVKELSFFNCKHLETTNLIDACKALKDLTSLDIRRCSSISQIFYNNLNLYCENLEVLKMSYSDVPFERVALLPKLKQYELLNYVQTVRPFDDTIFKALVQHKAEQLEILKISAKNALTMEHITLITKLKQLKILFVANNDAVTDWALGTLGNLQQLEELTIRGCATATTQGLLYLLKNCKKLHYINVQFCKNITCEFVKEATLLLKTEKCKRNIPLQLLVYGSSINKFGLSLCPEYMDTKQESLFKIVFHNSNPYLGLDDGVDVYDTWEGVPGTDDNWSDEEDDINSTDGDDFYFPPSEDNDIDIDIDD